MEEFDELVKSLEVVLDAINDANGEMGFEAVTVFLMQFIGVFGHSRELMARTFPVLEELKHRIQSEQFDEAHPIALALLAKLRAASAQTS